MRKARGGGGALSPPALREGESRTWRIDPFPQQTPRGTDQLVGLVQTHFRKCSQDETRALPMSIRPPVPGFHAGVRNAELQPRARRVADFVSRFLRFKRFDQRRGESRHLFGGPTVVPFPCVRLPTTATPCDTKAPIITGSALNSCLIESHSVSRRFTWGARGPEFKSRRSECFEPGSASSSH